jgi:hypothetical protein
MVDYGDPTVVGRDLRYNLFVINDRAEPDRNVRVLLQIPQGVEFRGITLNGNPVNHQFLTDGTISLPNIQYIRADEQIVYVFVLRPLIQQVMELQAAVSSDAQLDPFETSETTTVIGR